MSTARSQRLSIVGKRTEMFPQHIKFKFYPQTSASGLSGGRLVAASYMPELMNIRIRLPRWMCRKLETGQ